MDSPVRSNMIGYVRVSTATQEASGAGLEAQRAAVIAACELRGWHLDGIEEDALSGRTLRRPGLQRAIASCRSGEVAGIVVSKLDRLSRSLIDFASLLEQAQRESWNVVALDLGVDLSTPHGEFLAGVMASVAQWERMIIGERTREALEARRAQGVVLGRPSSISRALEVEIQGLRGAGMTLQGICDVLNSKGVPTSRGGAFWRPSALRAVLKGSDPNLTNLCKSSKFYSLRRY